MTMTYHIYSNEDIYKALKTKDYTKAVHKQFALAQKALSIPFEMSVWLESRAQRLLPDATFAATGDYEVSWDAERGKSARQIRTDHTLPFCSFLQFLRFVTDYPAAFEVWFAAHKHNTWLMFAADQVRLDARDWSRVSMCWEFVERAQCNAYWDDSVDSETALFALGVPGASAIESSVLSEPASLVFDISEIVVNGKKYRLVEES